jgi:nucleoid-associated protein YgaU
MEVLMPNNRMIFNKPKFSFDFSRDKLALLIGVLAIVALVFATYNFFNKNTDISSSQTERDEDQIVLKDKPATTGNEPKAVNLEKPNATGGSIVTDAMWVANDYKSGDITGASYTVVRGDTLWEIAEAVYGDGSQWTKILQANKTEIGFLPNGSQALIMPGQVLVLP